MRSNRLRDIPELVQHFGYDASHRLLQSSWFQLDLAPGGLGVMGDRTLRRASNSQSIVGPFQFIRFKMADPSAIVASGMQIIDKALGGLSRRSSVIKRAVADRLLQAIPDPHAQSLIQTNHDLSANHNLVLKSIANAASHILKRDVKPDSFQITMHETTAGYEVHTDMASSLSISEADVFRVVDEGIIGVSGLNEHIELMTTHQALIGAQANELSVYEGRLEVLLGHLNPTEQINRFTRVLSAIEVPLITADTARHVNLHKVLDIRETDEARAFRAWLWGVDSVTENELAERFSTLRNRLGLAIRTTSGGIIRFAISVLTGLIPGAGTAISTGLGALDTFLLERITSVPAPFVFLGNQYPSIFERPVHKPRG